MELLRALRINRGARVALVGAGGKTTALFQIARAFEPPVVVSASTHLGEWQSEFADRHFIVSRPEDLDHDTGQIEGVTLFTGPPSGDRRLAGLDHNSLERLNELADQLGFPVLLEADGSRQKPLKAPAEHEPVIPGWVRHVIVVAGLSALGQPLTGQVVHRPELFSRLSGAGVGDPIEVESLARVLGHPAGGLKNIPPGARRSLLLNQADDEESFFNGLRVANILTQSYKSILITSLNNHIVHYAVEPTAGILLAGGGSSRFGSPKILLPWRGKPLVRHAAEAALAGGLDPVMVVLGAVVEPARQALAGLPVQFVENEDWQAGQSTSLRRGLLSLPLTAGAAVFLLADQPAATGELVEALVRLHRQTLAQVIAPRVAGMRTNPVLFDRDLFPELLKVEGDTGGRAIFDRHPITYLDWEDSSLLIDVDTPDDLRRLNEKDTR